MSLACQWTAASNKNKWHKLEICCCFFLLAPLFKKKQLRANKSSHWAGSKNILLQEAVNRGLIYLLPTPISHVNALHQVSCAQKPVKPPFLLETRKNSWYGRCSCLFVWKQRRKKPHRFLLDHEWSSGLWSGSNLRKLQPHGLKRKRTSEMLCVCSCCQAQWKTWAIFVGLFFS